MKNRRFRHIADGSIRETRRKGRDLADVYERRDKGKYRLPRIDRSLDEREELREEEKEEGLEDEVEKEWKEGEDGEEKSLEIVDEYEKTSESIKLDGMEYCDNEKDGNRETRFSIPASINLSISPESQTKDILSKIFSKNYCTEQNSVVESTKNNYKRKRIMRDIDNAINQTKNNRSFNQIHTYKFSKIAGQIINNKQDLKSSRSINENGVITFLVDKEKK